MDAAAYRRLLDDHLGENCHRRHLRFWRRCSSAGSKRALGTCRCGARATAFALYYPRERLQNNWENPYTVLERLPDIICKLGDGTHKRLRIVHVGRMWTVSGGMQEMPLFPARARMMLSKLLPHLGVRVVTTLL